VADTGDEEQFKMLTRAYEVLGDADNRRSYDMGVDPTAPRGEGGFGGFSGFGGGNPFGAGGFGGSAFPGGTFAFQDLFETFFAGGGGAGSHRGPVPRARKGQDALLQLKIDLKDAVFGVTRDIEIDTAITCPLCHGDGAAPGSEIHTCDTCGGSGHVQRIQRSFLGQVMTTAPCPDCDGHGTQIDKPCPDCHGEGRVRERHTITVYVPAGVADGTRIRLQGRGDAGPGGGPAGDLYLEVHVAEDSRFTRVGDDLAATIEVPMVTAALGTSYRLNTLDGLRQVHIEPGTQPGAVITLPGLGFGHLRGTGRGDLLVTVRVVVPTSLTENQRTMLQQFQAERGEELPPLAKPAGKGPKRRRSLPRRKGK
jgi:molecular chaperone DnaJ